MRLASLLPIGLPFFFATIAVADDTSARRQQVESGLRPALPVEGVSFTIAERMAHHRVPGVSLAVLKGYEIEWVGAYGVRDVATGDPVTPETLFQAGSISKPIAAAAALALADAGALTLDREVNAFLTSWSLPENDLTRQEPVTLERILAHRGGLTVHGFWGYPNGASIPSVVEVLNGTPPANSAAVFVDLPPGSRFRYAGGGTTIAQQALCDVTGEPFAALVRRLVLEPSGMTRSTVQQPLPVDQWPDHSAGHLDDGWPTAGRWHVYPEQAAAGLWTTAHDIARFAREVGLSARGESNHVLTEATARRMLTPLDGGPTGLGVFIDDVGGEIYFQHGGSNVGFKNQFYVHQGRGDGVAIMTNGDGGGALGQELLDAVARVYGWPGWSVKRAIATVPSDDGEAEAQLCVGRYEIEVDLVVRIERRGAELHLDHPLLSPQRLVRIGEESYLAPASGARVRFEEIGDDGFEDVHMTTENESWFALRLDEDDPQVPIELLLTGHVDEATAAYRALHADEPEDPDLEAGRLLRFAAAAGHRGDAAARFALTSLCVEFHPESAEAWHDHARAALVIGKHEVAAAAADAALRTLPDDATLSPTTKVFLQATVEAMLRQ